MTREEIDKRIAELGGQKEAFQIQANLLLGKFIGKIELLEELRAAVPNPGTTEPDLGTSPECPCKSES
jgi:hypothetical protein